MALRLCHPRSRRQGFLVSYFDFGFDFGGGGCSRCLASCEHFVFGKGSVSPFYDRLLLLRYSDIPPTRRISSLMTTISPRSVRKCRTGVVLLPYFWLPSTRINCAASEAKISPLVHVRDGF